MKIIISDYVHSGNGICMEIKGETEHECQILHGIWHHGIMEINHSGYCIVWKPEPEDKG